MSIGLPIAPTAPNFEHRAPAVAGDFRIDSPEALDRVTVCQCVIQQRSVQIARRGDINACQDAGRILQTVARLAARYDCAIATDRQIESVAGKIRNGCRTRVLIERPHRDLCYLLRTYR